MTLQLTPALEQRLEHLAAQTHRSPEELAQEGMDRFLAYEEDVLAILQRGRADIAAGRIVPHEESFPASKICSTSDEDHLDRWGDRGF